MIYGCQVATRVGPTGQDDVVLLGTLDNCADILGQGLVHGRCCMTTHIFYECGRLFKEIVKLRYHGSRRKPT